MFAEIKINDRTYTMTGNGQTMMILLDEVGVDLFDIYNRVLSGYSRKAGFPINSKDMSALAYAFIKTANPEMFRDYKAFIANLTKPGDLITSEAIQGVMGILFDLMSASGSEEEKAEEPRRSKKKTTAKSST